MTLYKKLFENALGQPAVTPEGDMQAFEQGFEDEQAFQNVEQETQDITLSPEEIEALVKRGQMYKSKIDSFVGILNKIQADVTAGVFKSVSEKQMAKFAPIVNDLNQLGTALTTGVGDTIIKKAADKGKKSAAV